MRRFIRVLDELERAVFWFGVVAGLLMGGPVANAAQPWPLCVDQRPQSVPSGPSLAEARNLVRSVTIPSTTDDLLTARNFVDYLSAIPPQKAAAQGISPAEIGALPPAVQARLANPFFSAVGAKVPPSASQLNDRQLSNGAIALDQHLQLWRNQDKIYPPLLDQTLTHPIATVDRAKPNKGTHTPLWPGQRVGGPIGAANGSPDALAVMLSNFGHRPFPDQNAITFPGTPAPSGSLANALPHVAIALNRDRQCLLTGAQAEQFDATSNTARTLFDPSGFRQVALLLWRDATTKLDYHVCTATLLTPQLALTAAHCIFTQGLIHFAQRLGFNDSQRTLLLVPQADAEQSDPTRCFDANSSQGGCKYQVGTVQSAEPPPDTVWPGSDRLPRPDLALLSVKFSQPPAVDFAELDFSPTSPADVTLAGYGLTRQGALIHSGDLYVGWHSGAIVDAFGVKWVSSASATGAGACFGDSGGPVFSGKNYGVGERHSLIAVISSLDAPSTKITNALSNCEHAPGHAVRLADMAKWLCQRLGNGVTGCK